ncbi:MAG: four helix bundle protein [Rhizobiaceae bacterium]|nr:four helix bundle protein [Rhizobiaceae bacterium]
MDLAVSRHKISRVFPRDELFGLTSQLRRSSSSVAANIAEGHGRETSAAFVQFLRIAQGSLKETETHLILAGRLSFGESASIEAVVKDCDDIGRMLRSLTRSIQNKQT